MAKQNPLAETLCNKPASLSPQTRPNPSAQSLHAMPTAFCIFASAHLPPQNSNGQPELAVTTTLRDESLIPFPTLPDQSA